MNEILRTLACGEVSKRRLEEYQKKWEKLKTTLALFKKPESKTAASSGEKRSDFKPETVWKKQNTIIGDRMKAIFYESGVTNKSDF
jgi:hypothetical protein